uniref:Uncharacterized protein n=1 Tax=Cacopsylla melanoneura TaxID=428564 RepID=A0A8D8SQN5_9HEMI
MQWFSLDRVIVSLSRELLEDFLETFELFLVVSSTTTCGTLAKLVCTTASLDTLGGFFSGTLVQKCEVNCSLRLAVVGLCEPMPEQISHRDFSGEPGRPPPPVVSVNAV